MKIDFHCHTLKTKKDEPETRNVTIDLFKEKVIESGVKIIAITNHNYFDKKQYLEFSEGVKEHCQVWPGIELDVIGESGKKGHIIIVSDPNIVESFSDRMIEITKDSSSDDFEIRLNDLYEKVKDLNLIYIAHFYKKRELSKDDIEAFENILENKKRLFKEPSSLSSVTVLQTHKHRVLIGTDVSDWNIYENCDFGELKFEIKDFPSFIKLIEKDIDFIEDLVNKEFSEIVKVYGINSSKEFPFKIPIYKDVNIIFGDKGSGKSEILKSLNDYYSLEKSADPVYYTGGDKEQWYEELIGVNKDDEYIIDNIQDAQENRDEIKQIVDFVDKQPTPIKKYIEYFAGKTNKASKNKMKCLLINKRHLYDTEKYEKKYKEYKIVATFLKSYDGLEAKNLLDRIEQENLIDLLIKLESKVYNSAISEWYNQKSEYLIDDFVAKISTFVAENIGEPPSPTDTGFASFAKERLKLKYNSIKILNDLNKLNNITSKYIGDLGIKGMVYLTTKYSFINSANKQEIDHKTLKHTKGNLQSFIANLEKIPNYYMLDNLNQITQNLKQLYDEKEITVMSDFLSIERYFAINNEKYNPSKGEKSILALQHELLSKKDKNVFLIDEPDLSLGSIYINEVIVPLFKDLSNSQKILVVATHDANIAVRTRPLNSILKIMDNNNYKTYIGNMFSDKLINIENSDDTLSWKEQSIKYLEGGLEAFIERGDLYE